MNRAYRTVWSSARNAYVVASEKAKSRGKPSSTRSVLASAIALAFTAIAAPNAMAATSCNSVSGAPSLITVANPETACTLVAGDYLTLYSTGTINDSINTPVFNSEASPVTLLENNGTISFTYVPPATPAPWWAGTWAPAVEGAFTTITNTNTGTIAGADYSTSGNVGILLTGTSGTLTNSGTISAGFTAIEIGTSSSSSGVPSVVGTLTSLTNSGTISSTHGTAIIVNNGSNLSNFTNQSTGVITGSRGGFEATGGTMDSFVNQGAISTTSTAFGRSVGVGVNFRAAGSSSAGPTGTTLTGGLTNSGTISGAGGGIVMDSVTVGSGGTPANISNSGSITSPGGVALRINNSTLHGDIINQLGGTIAYTGTGSGTSIGISVSNSTLGSISNSGTIGGGIVVRSNSALSGSITNASGGVINASNWGGIQVDGGSTVAGNVLNAGHINMASSSPGIYIRRATVTGAVSNSGTIIAGNSSSSSSASGNGIRVSGATVGSISNSGTITTWGGTALDVSGTTVNGDIINDSNGVISSIGSSSTSSWGTAVSLGSSQVIGGFINRGAITAGGEGVSIGGTTLTNGIHNSGRISSIDGYAVAIGGMTASSLGALTNNGTISGGSVGVQIGNTTTRNNNDLQTLNNSGTIEDLGTGARFFNGYGIHLYFATLTSITNSGIISGSQKAIYVNTVTNGSTSVLTDLFIAGNNTAQFNGMVDAQATATSILNGATYTLRGTDDFRVASFTNNGTAQFAAGATAFDLTNVTGNTFTNNGVLTVGAGNTGTLTGNYTQAANATLRIGASDNTTYGKLVVSGTATLPTNANINVDVSNPNFAFTTTAMTGILTATTLTSDGTFAVTDNSVLFDFTAIKNGNAVDLSLAAAAAGGGAGTGPGNTVAAFNRQGNGSGVGAGGVIDELLARFTNTGSTGNTGMDAILTRLGTFTTDADLVAAVMQTVPTVAAALKRVSTQARAMVTSTLAARIRTASGQSSGDGFVTDGNAWFKPLGGWVKQDNKGAFSGYDANTYGFVAGADGELAGGARLGAALGITRTNVDDNSGVQKANVTGYQAGLYGSVEMAADYLVDWQADVGFNKNSGSRRITALGAAANSDYNGVAVHLGSGVSRNWELTGSDVLTPSLRADYSHLRDEAYTETGAGVLNLAVNGQTYHELLLVADGMWTHRLENNASLSANLGVAYDAHAKRDDLTSTYVGGGAAFGTLGINPSATTVRAGLGYAQTTASGMGVNLRYDVEGRSGYIAQGVSAKLSVPF